MGLVLLLLTFLSCSSGVTSRSPWTQSASETVAAGKNAKLSCTVNNDGYIISWNQQSPGQGPRFVHCTGCSSRGEGIPSRFTASTSGNVGYLTITNVQAGDEADYYCYMWSRTDNMWVFGTGTQLTMTGQPETPPTVHLFPPSAEEKQSKNKATLVCLMDNFNPPDITVAWKADGTAVSNGVETTRPTKQHDKYIASSYLTLDASEYARHDEYTCEVTHKGTVYPKTVVRSECP